MISSGQGSNERTAPKGKSDNLNGLKQHAPFDQLPQSVLEDLIRNVTIADAKEGETLFSQGEQLRCVYVIDSGEVDTLGSGGQVVFRSGIGEILGERGVLDSGEARTTVRVSADARLFLVPAEAFRNLVDTDPGFAEWFARTRTEADDGPYATGLTALRVADLMAREPITCPPTATVTEAARLMRTHTISSIIVMQGDDVVGIVTVRDLTDKVLAEGRPAFTPVSDVMTANPVTIDTQALGLDALVTLAEHRVSHLPVVERGRIAGMIGKTDLFRRQAETASHMIAEIVDADSAEAMATIVARTPRLLAQLVAAGVRPDAISRRITDITDAVTRRLLSLAEAALGAPPVPYLWLACGSQGRREQTGLSDQDNCLILDDGVTAEHDAYFAALAGRVSDGLNTCGFVYCPGDMMATNPRWRQPRRVWREYFSRWIAQPDTEAQMLASVMFDLRPISGTQELFGDLHRQTLHAARANSIFTAHMISNSLKHTPPLGLFRGLALIRSGEHKNTLDLKHSGVVPVTDLARVYALKGALEPVGTRARLEAAGEAGVISASGASELLDAYDLIAETRLRHQAARIRKGKAPDNFMAPGNLSELERNHLRDAFMVIKTMQSAVGHGTATLG